MAAKEGSARHEGLLRAGSWQVQGEAVLLKTASDIMLQMALSGGPKQHQLAAEEGGEGGKTNSVDSSSTAAGQRPHALLLDSATAGMLPPLRQISLDVIAASELNRAKGGASGSAERQSIFQDVFEQLAGKDDLPPMQSGQLYTLPSMQFLENMLNDFDRTGTSAAAATTTLHGPLDLPGDAFDLPEFSSRGGSSARQQEAFAALRPTPFDQQQAAAAQQQAYYTHSQQPDCSTAAGYAAFVPIGSAPASLQAQMGHNMHNSSGSLTLQASMRAQSAYDSRMSQAGMLAAPGHPHHMLLMQHQHYHQQAAAAAAAASAAATSRLPPGAASPGVRQPAVPQPAQPRATPRRATQPYADFDYEEAEVSLQTSKSGRVRKVASFTGVKRRLDVANGGNTASESRDSRGSVGGGEASSGEVGSRGSKGTRKTVSAAAKNRKGRRTVCLNCGCHQTPQWRCGPLGPRTLCNACGVRYKKDLPLNCWPIRDGMTLPPGALLPPGFVVPPGITIHTQPAEQE